MKKNTVIHDYEFQQQIGNKANTMVYKVINKKYNQTMIAKVISLTNEHQLLNLDAAEREQEVLCQLDHQNVIRIYDSFIEDNHYYLIFEECHGGSLRDAIENKTIVSEQEMRSICYQILEALFYIHSKKIAHRDIKPSSILLDNWRKPKLTDFGISVFMQEGGKCEKYSGSTPYLAPEILNKKQYDPFKADIWALGITFYQFVTGKTPWKSVNFVDLVKEIQHFETMTYPEVMSDNWKQLLNGMLQKDPLQRATPAELIKLPIFQGRIFNHQRKSSLNTIQSLRNFPPNLYRQNVKMAKSSMSVPFTFADGQPVK